MASKDRMTEFRKGYPLRAMKRQPANDDELKQMHSIDGMLDLEACGLSQLEASGGVAEPPSLREQASEGRFLWAVRSMDAPVALEECAWGHGLETKRIKHSNLTSGAPAHSGGELWVIQHQGVLVNANSGRYGADTPKELGAFVEALRELGFRAASMGFDLDNPVAPNVVQVGPVDWQTPYE